MARPNYSEMPHSLDRLALRGGEACWSSSLPLSLPLPLPAGIGPYLLGWGAVQFLRDARDAPRDEVTQGVEGLRGRGRRGGRWKGAQPEEAAPAAGARSRCGLLARPRK